MLKLSDDFKENATYYIKGIGKVLYVSTVVGTMAFSVACNRETSSTTAKPQQTITLQITDENFLGIEQPENYSKNEETQYEVGLYFDKKQGSLYYQIINKHGSTIDKDKYDEITKINDTKTILIDHSNKKSFLLDKLTGELKELPYASYYPLGNTNYFSIKLPFTEEREHNKIETKEDVMNAYINLKKDLSLYRLYDINGNLVTEQVYEKICYDSKTNLIYLSIHDGTKYDTEIIDGTNNKTKVIKDINVTEVKDGYFIAQDHRGYYDNEIFLYDTDNTRKYFVCYLTNIEEEPKSIMPKAFDTLKFLSGGTSPKFIAGNSPIRIVSYNISPIIIRDFRYTFHIIPSYHTKKSKAQEQYAVTSEDSALTVIKENGNEIHTRVNFGDDYVYYFGIDAIIDEDLIIGTYENKNDELSIGIFSLSSETKIDGDLKEAIPYYDDNDDLNILCIDKENNLTTRKAKDLIRKSYFSPKTYFKTKTTDN